MYYLYILYSSTSDVYYVGQTEDPWRRLDEHNHSDRTTYTSKHRPWELKALYVCGETREGAMRIEKFIKKQKSRVLLSRLAEGESLTGILAQLVRVPHVRD